MEWIYRSRHGKASAHAGASGPRILIGTVGDPAEHAAELRDGLLAQPARTAPKFLYDAQGSALYGAICTLAEYYPTYTEARIYQHNRAAIAAQLPRGGQWVDLGCGDGAKARPWFVPAAVRRYIGVDIAADWLQATLAATVRQFPGIDCVGVVTDLARPLPIAPVLDTCPDAPPIFFYPGSSIGNFQPDEALALLRAIRTHLGAHGRLLIGVDLVKERATLEAAYDDALGVTAAFNRNLLRVANRLLDADFEPRRFAHQAFFNKQACRIEMHLAALGTHHVRIGERSRLFEAGESIVTEYSYKYTPERFGALLEEAGYGDMHYWTDERAWFGVFVAGPGERAHG